MTNTFILKQKWRDVQVFVQRFNLKVQYFKCDHYPWYKRTVTVLAITGLKADVKDPRPAALSKLVYVHSKQQKP